jgi:two-component system chemotaxis sensor kinase CheA
MDVVKRNIEDLRGVIEVKSQKDKGSKIIIRLPLTLAIIDGFLVQSGHNKFIIPADMISQCMELTDEYKSDIKGANTINIRGNMIPLLNVRKFYNDKITPDELIMDIDDDIYRQNVIIVKFGTFEVGLLVDELYGQQQTVIKPLGNIFEKIPGISGGSILGSGEIAYILDIPNLIEAEIKLKI